MRDDMSEMLKTRLKRRIEELGTSAYAVSKKATGNEDAIRRIYRGHMPDADRLERIAAELQTTTAWLMGRDEEPAEPPARVRAPIAAFRGQDRPRDVPVLGTALGADMRIGGNGEPIEIERTIIEHVEVVDYLNRPIGIADRRDVYALYIVGSSMEPRYEPGDPVFVDPRRPPSIGDDVIVQLYGDEEEEGDRLRISAALVKRLVRRSSSFVELQQYNPAIVFKVDMNKVAHIHRIIPTRELAGF